MRSFKFPKMLNTNSSRIWTGTEYNESTTQNLITLLKVCRGELLGDPYFGLTLKDYFYHPNSYILKDMIIDVIYTQIAIFIPQIHIERKNIDIIQDKERGVLYCNFSGINQIDYKHNTFQLVLFEDKENK